MVCHDCHRPVRDLNPIHYDGAANLGVFTEVLGHLADAVRCETTHIGCPLGWILGGVLFEHLESGLNDGAIDTESPLQSGIDAVGVAGLCRTRGQVHDLFLVIDFEKISIFFYQ